MKLEYAGATHVGMKRDHNEDNLMLAPEMNLFVVADGMGGHSSGEVASQIAVDTIKVRVSGIASGGNTSPTATDENVRVPTAAAEASALTEGSLRARLPLVLRPRSDGRGSRAARSRRPASSRCA